MNPPIFATVRSSAAVRALLGNGPCRMFRFGDAPEGVAKPYAVWQMITGSPENYLGQRPDLDSFTIQIDVYSDKPTTSEAVALAIRDSLETVAHVTSYNGESRDPETKNYRYSFTIEWLIHR